MFEDSATYVAVLTIANALSDGDAIGDLPSGSGGFFLQGDVVGGFQYEEDTALATGSNYVFAWKDADGNLYKSPMFDGGDISNADFIAPTARTEQISYLGYNGTSGAMDESNSTYFGLKVVLNHTFGTLNNSPLIKTIPYKTVSSSSQSDLALGLVQAGYQAFKHAPNTDIVFDAVCNVAVNAAYDLSNTTTVVNGSKVINVASDLTYNTAAGTLVVGDFIRFASTLNGTLALTDDVYKVTAIDTLAVTLDRPVNVPSGAWTDAGDGIQVITAAQGAAADWGVKMVGSTPAATTFTAATDRPFVVSFDVLSDDFSTAEVTYSTAPALGTGTEEQVRALQAYAQFQDKDRIVSAYPPTVRLDEAEAGGTYDIYSFEVTNNNYTSVTTGIRPVSKWRMVICLDDSLTTDNTNFDAVLSVS